MQYNNLQGSKTERETARQTFQKILDYGIHEPLNDQEQQRRLQVLGKINDKIEHVKTTYPYKPDIKKSLEQNIFIPCFSDWRLFSAVVNSVKHLTQLGGQDDYCLLSYESDKRTLYIAREMFSGLPSLDLVVEFLFTELACEIYTPVELKSLFKDNYTPDTKRKNKTTLPDYLQELVKKRVIPYNLQDLAETLIDFAIEDYGREKGEELSKESREYYTQKLSAEVNLILQKNPKNLREFPNLINHLKKGDLSSSDLGKILGEAGVWNAKMYKLASDMRLNLANGEKDELDKLFTNLYSLWIIKEYFLTNQEFVDKWTIIESENFVKDYREFTEQIREYIRKTEREFKKHLKKRYYQESIQVKQKLIMFRDSSFPRELDIDTQKLVDEINQAIQKMDKKLKTQPNPF